MKCKCLIKKINKASKIIGTACTVATIAMAIYTAIPKYDKIDGLDTQTFINNLKHT